MSKITEEEIINDVYNLIVDVDVHEDERAILVNFKNRMTAKADFKNELMNLEVGLRQLAIENLSRNKKMSSAVGNFYKKISSYGQIELNWARGLAMTSWMF